MPSDEIIRRIASRREEIDEKVVRDALALCPDVDPELSIVHFSRIRNLDKYLRDFTPAKIACQLELLSRLTDRELVVLNVDSADSNRGFEITVAGVDLRGVSACVTGCLAEMGLSIAQLNVVTYQPSNERGKDSNSGLRLSLGNRYIMVCETAPSELMEDAKSLASQLRARLKASYWHLIRGDVQRAWQETDNQDDLVGETIDDRYRIDRRLGQGGMGTIYLATQIDLDRPVAVKVLRSNLISDKTQVEQLQKEGRLQAQVSSPHVVDVHDAGIDEDRCWIAMEYMAGGDVGHWIEYHGVPPVELSIRWLVDALQGLIDIHSEAEILHCDMKPNNLLLDAGMNVKLGDLGLSQLHRTAQLHEPDGKIRGTLWYMSPEQAGGRRVDKRSDLYSLGCTFFHIFTGSRPFDAGSPAEILSKIIRGEKPPLRDMAPGLPYGTCVVIDRMMQRDPYSRYQDASIALLDLQSYPSMVSFQERRLDSSTVPKNANEAVKHRPFNENVVTKTYFEEKIEDDAIENTVTDEFHLTE